MNFDFDFYSNKYGLPPCNDISDEDFESLNKKFILNQHSNLIKNMEIKVNLDKNEHFNENDHKEKKRKDHIQSEKRRRNELNNNIDKLKNLLDCVNSSKADVLKNAADEITKLRKLNDDLKFQKNKLDIKSLIYLGYFNKDSN